MANPNVSALKAHLTRTVTAIEGMTLALEMLHNKKSGLEQRIAQAQGATADAPKADAAKADAAKADAAKADAAKADAAKADAVKADAVKADATMPANPSGTLAALKAHLTRHQENLRLSKSKKDKEHFAALVSAQEKRIADLSQAIATKANGTKAADATTTADAVTTTVPTKSADDRLAAMQQALMALVATLQA